MVDDDKYMVELMHEVDGEEYSIQDTTGAYKNKQCYKCLKLILSKTLWVCNGHKFLCHGCYRKYHEKYDKI